MSIAYSGGTIVNSTFTANVKSDIITNMQTLLTSAGWSVSAGSGSTTDLTMLTATTPQSLAMKYRFKDNSGSCVQISIANVAGTATGTVGVNNGASILPATSRTYRVIAGPYYFWIFQPSSFSNPQDFAFGGVPWVPAAYSSGVTDMGYLVGQCLSDSSTSVPVTFRNGNSCNINNSTPNQQLIYNGQLVEWGNSAGSNNNGSMLQPWVYVGSSFHNTGPTNMVKYVDGSFASGDPWIMWSKVLADNDPRIMGMFWDTVFSTDSSQSGDVVTSFDSHSWWSISNAQMPNLWVVEA